MEEALSTGRHRTMSHWSHDIRRREAEGGTLVLSSLFPLDSVRIRSIVLMHTFVMGLFPRFLCCCLLIGLHGYVSMVILKLVELTVKVKAHSIVYSLGRPPLFRQNNLH